MNIESEMRNLIFRSKDHHDPWTGEAKSHGSSDRGSNWSCSKGTEMLDRSPRLTLAANLTLESYVGVLRDRYVHSLMETVTGTYGVPYSSFSSRVSPSVNTLERVELEVVLLIEPAALEELQRQSGSSGKSEGVDRQLHVRVLFLSCVRLVIEDVDIAVPDL